MRTLLLAVSAVTLCALAACGRHAASTDNSATAAAPPRQPAATPAPPPRPVTEASAVTGGDGAVGGAYGMPRAPIPYSELDAYERQRGPDGRGGPPSSLQPGPPGQPPGPPKTQTAKPRSADTVFY